MVNVLHTDSFVYSMNQETAPVLTVAADSDVAVDTLDCFTDQIRENDYHLDSLNFSKVNPATGPIYVAGAEVGDILAVHIKQISIADQGVVISTNLIGALRDKVSASEVKLLQIRDSRIEVSPQLWVPLNPMIGVIGVAPKQGDDIVCGTPDYHGGNMDTKEIAAGATVFLRVNCSGGLLSLGDLHGAMGDGEIGGSGLEIAGKVDLHIRVIKGLEIPTPAIGFHDKLYFLHSDESLDVAADGACEQALSFLRKNMGLDVHTAIRYMSLAGNVGISQIVNPKKTAKFALDINQLKRYDSRVLDLLAL